MPVKLTDDQKKALDDLWPKGNKAWRSLQKGEDLYEELQALKQRVRQGNAEDHAPDAKNAGGGKGVNRLIHPVSKGKGPPPKREADSDDEAASKKKPRVQVPEEESSSEEESLPKNLGRDPPHFKASCAQLENLMKNITKDAIEVLRKTKDKDEAMKAAFKIIRLTLA